MRKNGFLQIGVVVIIATIVSAGILVNKLKLKNSEAGREAPPSCGTYENDKSSNYTCGPIDRSEAGACGNDPTTKCIGKEFCKAYRNERRCNGTGKYGNFTNVHCCEGTDYTCELVAGKCGYNEKTPTPTATPTKSPSPTPVVTKSPSPKPTPTPTKSPKPTKSPSPTPVINLKCNSYCINSSQCLDGLTCSWGKCRNPSCTKNSNCICSTATPSPQPSPTVPAGTATPKPGEAKLIICKYHDENGNGYKDSEDNLISWGFSYEIDGTIRDVNSTWWNTFRRGCVSVKVPFEKTIKVREDSKDKWDQTAIYADGSRVGGGDYFYQSHAGQNKEVWFLNTQHKDDEPNSCNGTCGSNYNCKSDLYCYKGYCRNPRNPESSTCSEPTVLSATAPPVLPKTGMSTWQYALSFMGIGATGIYLYKRFKLI